MTGSHEIVNPGSLAAPSGFSHAVISNGGRVVWLAGQTAMDADGAIVGTGDIAAQFERALQNLLTVLAAAGGRPEHLVSMTTYVVDLDGYRTRARELGQIWRRLVGRHYPAAAAIGVSRLWDRDALVEVQGVAVLMRPARASEPEAFPTFPVSPEAAPLTHEAVERAFEE